ncbi:putative ribosome biogenesis protein BOP1 [Monocercomonoides exilis]|uniref:putative ribosome biogenesis protein BOP1 n=1 Tax=Monocercomonoides exilis TaxID=2049356 RepID=UPI00355A8791|nr:putative ribosome biogenesis protein BOP1 [Monocercomonoides exilis]|eukprot:MONOS_4082.1-p1 / transcript=MONOS_4082.1 / gene=MONOS_4082 / organism=Monocercomonoides_exilis_PA203 / gene_product=ribosome biogenesis protein BOP1 / transcript_product=ribosome biogenesis protein BOP1 / location=Mono_scaffold00104:19662-22486(+) / protein_length=597 / sequence_SO=supercontig / SO=protein_coding / is_pseudo=false
MADPAVRRTIRDDETGEEIQLTDEELQVLLRIESGRFPSLHSDDPIDVSFEYDSIHPVSNRLRPKSSFIPSKTEFRKINEFVHKLRIGAFKEKPKQKEEIKDLWRFDNDPKRWRSKSKKIPAPMHLLPHHSESYNPPEEYLFTENERKRWEESHPEDRKLDYIPQKFETFRAVTPYASTFRDQYQRYLDLFLFPRMKHRRVKVDPDSLLPSLPDPMDLLPFPQILSTEWKGHASAVTALDTDRFTGQYLASGSADGCVRVWDVTTGRCVRSLQLPHKISYIAWNPSRDKPVLAVASGNTLCIYSPALNQADAQAAVNFVNPRKTIPASAMTKKVAWSLAAPFPEHEGILMTIEHSKLVTHLNWHAGGVFLSAVMSDNSSSVLLIHNITGRQTVKPSNKKRQAKCGLFHPTKPQFFVAFEKHVEVYSLDKGQSVRKLRGSMQLITSMAIHPSGDHLVVCSGEGRISWFDLNAETMLPYRTLSSAATPFYHVCFHRSFPLFAASTMKGSIQIVHGSVPEDDPEGSPVIVPVKILNGPKRRIIHNSSSDDSDDEDEEEEKKDGGDSEELIVPAAKCCIFHPTQPWVFGGFDDGVIRLFI